VEHPVTGLPRLPGRAAPRRFGCRGSKGVLNAQSRFLPMLRRWLGMLPRRCSEQTQRGGGGGAQEKLWRSGSLRVL